MFKPKNADYDTAPIFEALVSQTSYVGIWICESSNAGRYYQVDFNLVGYMSAEDKAKTHPPRHVDVEVGAGWFEDHMSIASRRKPSVYVKTYQEAMQIVMDDIAEHKLEDNVV